MNRIKHSGKNLEVCLSSDHTALLRHNSKVAFASGASRIELCSQLSCGGLSPSIEAISHVVTQQPKHKECIVMLRSANDFFIDTARLYQLQQQLQQFAQAGASGVALGFIDHDSNIATQPCQSLIAMARDLKLSITFHRAFDAVANWRQAADTLLELGVDRVLSSGSEWTSQLDAAHSINHLTRLLHHFSGEIELVIGGGVTPQHADKLWQLQTFGPLSLHAHSGVHTHQGEVCPRLIREVMTAAEEVAQR